MTYAYLQFLHERPKCNPSEVYRALLHLLNGRKDLVQPKSAAEHLDRLLNARRFRPSDFTATGEYTAGNIARLR